MKKILKLLLAASFFTTIGTNVSSVKAVMNEEIKNLVVNWDFESENDEGWEARKNGSIAEGVSYGNGRKSGIVPSGYADGYVGQFIEGLKKNTTYRITAQAKVDKEGGKALLGTRVYKDNPWEANGDKEKIKWTVKERSVASTEWQEYSYDFQTSMNTDKVFLSLTKWTIKSDGNYQDVLNCNAYIDNVVIEEIPCAQLPDDSEFDVVWKDDFSCNKLDTKKWGYETGYVRNNELQEYVTDKENVYVKDGNLVLKATKKDKPVTMNGHELLYNSGSIDTFGRQDILYGKIEMRAKLVNGKGFWPAFWTLGSNSRGWPACGEIDIMEAPVIDENGINYDSHATLHFGEGKDRPWFDGAEGMYSHSEDLANDYHVYGINWTPEKIQWYFDGEIFYEWDIKDLDYFHKPHHIKLNLAVGGDWPGSPNELTQFPAEYKVDYVSCSQTAQQAQASKEFYKDVPQISVKDITVAKGTKIVPPGGKNGVDLSEDVIATDKQGNFLKVNISPSPSELDTNTIGETTLFYTAVDSDGVPGRANATLKVVETLNRKNLEKLIGDVKLLNSEKYTKDSWAILQKVLNYADLVDLNKNVTQEKIDNTCNLLQDAKGALEEKTVGPSVDKGKLEDVYNDYKDLKKGDYTDKSWIEFQKELDNAKTVLENKDATQEKVDNAFELLQGAKDALQEKPIIPLVDKGKLEEVYNKYKDLKQGNYTDESWIEFQKELDNVKNVLENKNATQKEVDNTLKLLGDAKNQLKLSDDVHIDAKPEDKLDISEIVNTGDQTSVLVTAAIMLLALGGLYVTRKIKKIP